MAIASVQQNNLFFVYVLENLINGKIYVGQTTTHFFKRWRKHVSVANGQNDKRRCYFQNAIKKHGEDNFVFKDVISVKDKSSMNLLEKLKIKQLKSNNRLFGYNLTSGGEGTTGYKMKEATKELLRKINLGKKHTKEHCDKISKANKGRPVKKGYTLTFEHRAKLSIAQKGKKKPKRKYETILRGSNSPGAKFTEEIIYNMRIDYSRGISRKEIINKYNINRKNLSVILANKTWKHVKI